MKRLLYLCLLTTLPALLGADEPETTEPAPLDPEIEAQLLLGPFEGHGLAHPKDAKRAHRSRALAQRMSRTCYGYAEQRSGGSRAYAMPCTTAKVTAADVPAMLDRLNDVDIQSTRHWDAIDVFGQMTAAVAATGRTDVVPALVTALERLALRAQHAHLFEVTLDDDVRFLGVEDALVALTHHRVERAADGRSYAGDVLTLTLQDVAEKWRAWHDAHGADAPKTWREAAVETARARATSSDPKDRLLGVLDLRDIGEKGEAQRLARSLAREHPDIEYKLAWALPKRRSH